MRVKKISVTGLFGIFNHEIPLNLDERLTIIHGPNGFGKTTLLKMLHDIFNNRYAVFQSTPFENFLVEFDEGSYIKVTPQKPAYENQPLPLKIELFHSEIGKPELFDIEKLKKLDSDIPPLLENYIKGLNPLDNGDWYYTPTKETFTMAEMLKRFDRKLPDSVTAPIKKAEKLKSLRNLTNVYFIQTQRLVLQSLGSSSNSLWAKSIKTTDSATTVVRFSEEIAEIIEARKADFADLAQSLDRTFPTRLLAADINNQNEKALRDKLTQLERQQQRLQAVGLLDKNEDAGFQPAAPIDEQKRAILSIYLEDMEKKLSVYDELADKIELLKSIINSRFHYKNLEVDPQKGFIFTDEQNRILQLERLSSGEQHELIMVYELLFKIEPGSLILIDEPELSLHVAWQVQVLKDLKQIADLVQLDILMATHSPQIINDRWDLTVALTRPDEDE